MPSGRCLPSAFGMCFRRDGKHMHDAADHTAVVHRFPCKRLLRMPGWGERGEQKQAVGRSRGGRNTKIHALADAKGRLLAILLTGVEAHDCPVAERLIRRVKPSKRCSATRPTTAPNCVLTSTSAEPSRSFPIAVTGNSRSASAKQAALAHRERLQQAERLQAHRDTV